MRCFRQVLYVSSLIGLLLCMSCGKLKSPDVKNGVKPEKSEEEKLRDRGVTEEAIENALSELAERHKARRNWLAFAESAAIDHQVFTLQYQDALTNLNGQSIIVVGSVGDVRRIGDRYRMLFRSVVEPSRQFKPHYIDVEVAFDLEADAASANYVIEMVKKHEEETDQFHAGFAIAISPTRLRVEYDRDVSADEIHDDDGSIAFAEVVEGPLHPKFTILGQCREVRYLKGFDPF